MLTKVVKLCWLINLRCSEAGTLIRFTVGDSISTCCCIGKATGKSLEQSQLSLDWYNILDGKNRQEKNDHFD